MYIFFCSMMRAFSLMNWSCNCESERKTSGVGMKSWCSRKNHIAERRETVCEEVQWLFIYKLRHILMMMARWDMHHINSNVSHSRFEIKFKGWNRALLVITNDTSLLCQIQSFEEVFFFSYEDEYGVATHIVYLWKSAMYFESCACLKMADNFICSRSPSSQPYPTLSAALTHTIIQPRWKLLFLPSFPHIDAAAMLTHTDTVREKINF